MTHHRPLVTRFTFASLLVAVSGFLAACGGESATPAPVADAATAATPKAMRATAVTLGVGVPSRRYLLVNASSGKCMDVANASKVDGGNIQQTACNNNLAQAFDMVETSAGIYKLTNAGSGKVVDVASSSHDDRANVQQWTDNGSQAQRFELKRTHGNRHTLINTGSGKCVDVTGASAADGANIQQYSCNGTGAQQFYLVPFGASGRGVLPLGRYTLANANSGLCVDIVGGSLADGARMQQSGCTSAFAQRFDVSANDTGTYSLIDVASGKALDISSASTADGATVQQWAANTSNNQRFSITVDGSGFRLQGANSGKCVEVRERSTAAGATIQQWACDGSSHQRWQLAPEAAVDVGRYQVKAVHSGKCMDVVDAAANDGARIQQWRCSNSGAQAFDISRDSEGYYLLGNANSKKLVDVAAWGMNDGTSVQQWTDGGKANQRFSLTPLGDGQFEIRARHSGRCLDVAALSASDGAVVQQWTCNGKSNQHWALTTSSWNGGGPGGDTPMAAKRKQVLDYLVGVSGKKTLVGMHNKNAGVRPTADTDAVTAITGKVPAFWAADFGFGSVDVDNRWNMVAEAKRQFNKGAMVSIIYHACSPTRDEYCSWDDIGDKWPAKLSNDQFTELTTAGTALNKAWLQRLDTLAMYLANLKEAGVVVLFRPLHEMNQCVFWWACHKGPNGTARLWQITHDYLNKTKGLDNLIWVWNVQDFPSLSAEVNDYNPGSAYFDVASLDIYNTGWTQNNYDVMLQAAGGKPIAVGECQFMPTADLLTRQNRWAFVMLWPDFIAENKSSLPALYRADNVVTLDEMPGWK